MAVTIKSFNAYQIFDSFGYPTIGGKLVLSDGRHVYSSVPNYLHRPKYAAEYLYDEQVAFNGKGVTRSIKYLNELIAPKLVNFDPLRYRDADLWLTKADPSENKEALGANTTFIVSQLIYEAAALVSAVPLYRFISKVYNEHFEKREVKRIPPPIFNAISGGEHGAASLTFQDFAIILSTGFPFSKALEMAAEFYHELASAFKYRNIFAGIGTDGSYIPNLSSNFDALEIIKEALVKKGYRVGLDVFYSLDIAAGFFYKGGKYYLTGETGTLDSKQLFEYLEKIFKEYRFLMVEDPYATSDTHGWKMLLEKLGEKVYVVGDDLLGTNKARLNSVAKDKLCSVVNTKLSQRGTLWEIFEYIAGARKSGLKVLISQSAIETNETFLADFAVGVQADFIKFGAPVRGERVAKYNRLLAIERELGHG